MSLAFKTITLALLRAERRRSPGAKREVAAGDMAEIQKAHCQILWAAIKGNGIVGILDVVHYLQKYGERRGK